MVFKRDWCTKVPCSHQLTRTILRHELMCKLSLRTSSPNPHSLPNCSCFCSDKLFPALNYWLHNSSYDPSCMSSRFGIYLSGWSSRPYRSMHLQLPVTTTVMNTISFFHLGLFLATLSMFTSAITDSFMGSGKIQALKK